ncbi:MAG TPA: DUF308 domain-containing protein, partial [Gemmatimonadales bacterium]|nr:DUF308 domain-containing protein [Gemmatimonadales bacterium]
KEIPNEWMLIFAGALSVVAGILLVTSPIIGALALIWVVAVWAMAFGLLMIGLAVRVRSHKRS